MKGFVLVSALLLAAGSAAAHNGGLDKNGCHNNNKLKTYECHQGALKDQSFKSKDEADKKLGLNTPKAGQQSAAAPAERKAPPAEAKKPPAAAKQ